MTDMPCSPGAGMVEAARTRPSRRSPHDRRRPTAPLLLLVIVSSPNRRQLERPQAPRCTARPAPGPPPRPAGATPPCAPRSKPWCACMREQLASDDEGATPAVLLSLLPFLNGRIERTRDGRQQRRVAHVHTPPMATCCHRRSAAADCRNCAMCHPRGKAGQPTVCRSTAPRRLTRSRTRPIKDNVVVPSIRHRLPLLRLCCSLRQKRVSLRTSPANSLPLPYSTAPPLSASRRGGASLRRLRLR